METNQNPAQVEQPAQLITPATPQLYNPAEAAQIVKHLTNGFFDPEYILLFGSLVGGTVHSDAAAYDLLMVVREIPEYGWIQAKRMLRLRMPVGQREIPHINLYIMPLSYLNCNRTPFLYFAHREGELLYCNDRYHFQRPKHRIDFAAAYADAKIHFDTFSTLGNQLIEQAHAAFNENRNLRLAALFAAQAAVYYYHTFYYVYHGLEFDSRDPVVMHDRMRTLSTQLMLALDDTHLENIFTLSCFKRVLQKAHYDVDFDVPPFELEKHMERVAKMGEILENHCEQRLELYKQWSER